MKPTMLSDTQRKILRVVGNAPNGRKQISGHGAAPYLSAARALVRKGLLCNAIETGVYFISDVGRKTLEGQ